VLPAGSSDTSRREAWSLFNASLHIPPSPSGDYEFRIEAKVERHVYPHSVLLVADVDVPVQPWPPGVFADDTVNEVVMGTFCDGD
jgi:hypothetical protein